jgi:hypothetical protein
MDPHQRTRLMALIIGVLIGIGLMGLYFLVKWGSYLW